MSQPHRKGHQSKNKVVKRRIEHKQRQAAKVFLAGKTAPRPKKKPTKGEKGAPPVAAYPCGPKQMTLGEMFKSQEGNGNG